MVVFQSTTRLRVDVFPSYSRASPKQSFPWDLSTCSGGLSHGRIKKHGEIFFTLHTKNDGPWGGVIFSQKTARFSPHVYSNNVTPPYQEFCWEIGARVHCLLFFTLQQSSRWYIYLLILILIILVNLCHGRVFIGVFLSSESSPYQPPVLAFRFLYTPSF